VVSACEGREALDVHPEQAGERVGLGLAEGRELGGDVLHRAVTLAQLDAGQAAGPDGTGGRGEAVLAEGLDEGLGASGGIVTGGGEAGGIPLLERADAAAGEVADGSRTRVLLEVAQHLDGERVVVGFEGAVPGVGHDVGAGGTTTATAATGGLVRHNGALLDQRVEVTTHGGGGQVEVTTELGGRDGAVGGDHVEHPRARARLERRDVLAVLRLTRCVLSDKHHTIVT
jgi:hypothetical protein